MNAVRDLATATGSKVRTLVTGQPSAQAVAGVVPTPPPPTPPAEPVLGLCLSGGGSRALTGALGTLSGLRSLPTPGDPTSSVVDGVSYLSSVSGGTWAAIAYTFLPAEVGGEPIDDDTFLIEPVAPDQLVKSGEKAAGKNNVEFMDPRCLGTSPQRFAPLPIAQVLYKYFKWGFFTDTDKWSWFWPGAIGELLLRPFELYDAKYPRRSDVTQPSHFFSLSREYVASEITDRNADMQADQFHCVRPGRPALVVNFNLLTDRRLVDPIQVPIQATPEVTGMLGESPDGTIVGGGSVQSFGFATELAGPANAPDTALVDLTRRYSLSDISACSSAFFAEQILGAVQLGMDRVEDAVTEDLKRHFVPTFIGRWLARRFVKRLEPIIDATASNVIPRYPYWPLDELEKNDPSTTEYGFSDGGSFENTGVLGMLARTDANRIIASVNGAAPLAKDSESGEIMVDSSVATLFGYRFDNDAHRYVSRGGMNPDNPRGYAQVFSDDDGEFDAIRQGLWDASTGNGADPPGTNTVAFTHQLTTVDNPVAKIVAGREVTVLWVLNNRVNAWQELIDDAGIKADLEAGQAAQNEDGTPNGDGHAHGPLENFPLYTTAPQIYLDKEAVNMMAQLSAWNIQQLSDEIVALLEP